jgi:hypothetical protein
VNEEIFDFRFSIALLAGVIREAAMTAVNSQASWCNG